MREADCGERCAWTDRDEGDRRTDEKGADDEGNAQATDADEAGDDDRTDERPDTERRIQVADR